MYTDKKMLESDYSAGTQYCFFGGDMIAILLFAVLVILSGCDSPNPTAQNDTTIDTVVIRDTLFQRDSLFIYSSDTVYSSSVDTVYLIDSTQRQDSLLQQMLDSAFTGYDTLSRRDTVVRIDTVYISDSSFVFDTVYRIDTIVTDPASAVVALTQTRQLSTENFEEDNFLSYSSNSWRIVFEEATIPANSDVIHQLYLSPCADTCAWINAEAVAGFFQSTRAPVWYDSYVELRDPDLDLIDWFYRSVVVLFY